MDFKQNKPTAAEWKAAEFKAQALYDKVARQEAEGDPFTNERLKIIRLLTIAMGKERANAPALLNYALLKNAPAAEALVVGHLAQLMVLA